MTRALTFLIACAAAAPLTGQSVLVNTRLQPMEFVDPAEQLTLDLREYFQFYPEPGPVATFTISMPEAEGMHTFDIDGESVEMMRYALPGGEHYEDPYSVTADQYVWAEHQVAFNLFPAEAPVTVANFMTYVADGAYANTIVHRNESTGRVFGPGGARPFNPLPIVQAGGFRLYPGDEFLLEVIPTRPAIPFEQTRNNTAGTLAMARSSTLDSATSQFFVNLEDNTNAFRDAYAVFGELVDPEAGLAILESFANAPVYDLSSPWESGSPNIFANLPFGSIPLYAPEPMLQSSYARFQSVSVSEGDPEGASYTWEFVDVDGDEEVSEDEAANRAVFDIRVEGTNLVVSRNDTGVVRIRVNASGSDQNANFEFDVIGYNERALDQFPQSIINQGGWLENSWYGWIAADTFPEIFHPNHGYQFVGESESSAVFEAFDRRLGSWIFTSPTLYPSMFIYAINKWVHYLEDTGNGVDEDRWFYVYDGDQSDWVAESALIGG
jgi:cyclophilin family peptidyl-prolyl cis-trans isomerase